MFQRHKSRSGFNYICEDDDNVSKNNDIDDKGVIVQNNRIYFYTSISSESILLLNRLIHALNIKLTKASIKYNFEPIIYLHIQSDGGEIFPGLSGHDHIRNSKIPIYTIVDGYAASAATFLALAGKKRFITKNSSVLIHQLTVNEFWGKYEELLDECKNSQNLMKQIKDLYAEHSSLPKKKIDEIMKRELYFSSKECLRYNLVDEIL